MRAHLTMHRNRGIVSTMQILSNALPGFRDLRGPIIAGYMWLVLAWLWLTPDIHTRPRNPVAASIYDLGHDIGRVAFGVALSVVAYLIGAVSQDVSTALRDAVIRARSLWRLDPGVRLEKIGEIRINRPLDPDDPFAPLAARAWRAVLTHGPSSSEVLAEQRERQMQRIRERESEARAKAQREVQLPATLLVGDKPELFAEVDRLKAEGELRLAVAPPLAALISFAALNHGHGWYWVALIGVVVLFVQGLRRESDSRNTIANAIAYGTINSPSLAQFRSWVEEIEKDPESLLPG